MPRISPYLELIRPANIVTAWADILAGFALITAFSSAGPTGAGSFYALVWLLLSTSCLYAGGIVFNDIFDLELDRRERPERVLPSGRLSLRKAQFFGVSLLLLGVAAAAQVQSYSGSIACLVAFLAVSYDAFGEERPWLGPLNMGACRGANLLLGMSVVPALLSVNLLALLPIIYISTITLISRGEVSGSGRQPLYFAMASYSLLYLIFLTITLFSAHPLWQLLPFLLVHSIMVFPPLLKAVRAPIGPNIGPAVKAGVIGLIPFDAAMTASSGQWQMALIIILLLPISLWLSRIFAVS